MVVFKTMKILILTLFVLFLSACGKEENISLKKCWTLAERGEDFQLYYPCGDARLSSSRFSPTYKFHSKDTCEYLVLSPNDGHYFKDGVYEYTPEISTLTIKSKEGDLVVKFKILDLKSANLKVEVLDGIY